MNVLKEFFGTVIQMVLGIALVAAIFAGIFWLGGNVGGLFVPETKAGFWKVVFLTSAVLGGAAFLRAWSLSFAVAVGFVAALLAMMVMGFAWVMVAISSPCHAGLFWLLSSYQGISCLAGVSACVGIFYFFHERKGRPKTDRTNTSSARVRRVQTTRAGAQGIVIEETVTRVRSVAPGSSPREFVNE